MIQLELHCNKLVEPSTVKTTLIFSIITAPNGKLQRAALVALGHRSTTTTQNKHTNLRL
mgnify:FL=1